MDKKLVKNNHYLVKILKHRESQFIGVKVKGKFTGTLFRSLSTNEYLYLEQIEVIKEIEAPGKPSTNNPTSSNQTTLAL